MRYVVLVLLNLPIILLAFINMLTQYKMHKVSKQRFQLQLLTWLAILILLISSFPLFNYFNDKPILDSSELSLFDIVQTTAIIFLFYIINHQRQNIERNEITLQELHRELSIKLSKNGKNKL